MIQLNNIPFPISVNTLYANGCFPVKVRGKTKYLARKYLTKEGKAYINAIDTYHALNRKEFDISKLIGARSLNVIIVYESKWKNKDGSWKKKDVTNFDKILIDQIFKKLQIDDSMIESIFLNKHHSDVNNYAHMTIQKHVSETKTSG